VTGGSGFLGSSVLRALVAESHQVVGLARSGAAGAALAALGAEVVYGDLDDLAALDAAFGAARADALVNLASLGFGHAPAIVAAAEEAGIDRAVFVSTTAIYTTLPAASRATRVGAEAVIEASGLRWTILRPTMIYGNPGDRNLVRLLRLLRRSPIVPLPGSGRHLVQPVHVDDLAAFTVTVLDAEPAYGRALTVAGPEPLSLRDLVTTSGRAVGRRPVIIPVPLGPAVALVGLYERIAPRPRIKAEQLLRLEEDKAFDIGPAAALGYTPRSFPEGIAAEAAMLR